MAGSASSRAPGFLVMVRSEPQFGEARMIVGARRGAVPVELALRFGDREVVDAGMAQPHQAVGVELPVLVAIGAEPVAGHIVNS